LERRAVGLDGEFFGFGADAEFVSGFFRRAKNRVELIQALDGAVVRRRI
jgi:hypothetical protein